MAEAAIAFKFSFFGFPIRPFPEWVLCGNFPREKKKINVYLTQIGHQGHYQGNRLRVEVTMGMVGGLCGDWFWLTLCWSLATGRIRSWEKALCGESVITRVRVWMLLGQTCFPQGPVGNSVGPKSLPNRLLVLTARLRHSLQKAIPFLQSCLAVCPGLLLMSLSEDQTVPFSCHQSPSALWTVSLLHVIYTQVNFMCLYKASLLKCAYGCPLAQSPLGLPCQRSLLLFQKPIYLAPWADFFPL